MITISVSEACKGCGVCVKKCPTKVFELKDNRSVPKNLEDCMACRYCEVVCPQKGICVIEV